jgi:uncharacterized protein with PQ loop repeat
MFTQFLGTAATVYGVLGALKTLLQARQMLARRTSGDVSAGFLASYAGGYAIWLAYGLSAGSLPLIVVDTAGLFCGGLTLAVALSLRLAYPPSHLEQPQHDVNLTKTRSPGPATPHPPGLRSEMDIVSEEYGVDQDKIPDSTLRLSAAYALDDQPAAGPRAAAARSAPITRPAPSTAAAVPSSRRGPTSTPSPVFHLQTQHRRHLGTGQGPGVVA